MFLTLKVIKQEFVINDKKRCSPVDRGKMTQKFIICRFDGYDLFLSEAAKRLGIALLSSCDQSSLRGAMSLFDHDKYGSYFNLASFE